MALSDHVVLQVMTFEVIFFLPPVVTNPRSRLSTHVYQHAAIATAVTAMGEVGRELEITCTTSSILRRKAMTFTLRTLRWH